MAVMRICVVYTLLVVVLGDDGAEEDGDSGGDGAIDVVADAAEGVDVDGVVADCEYGGGSVSDDDEPGDSDDCGVVGECEGDPGGIDAGLCVGCVVDECANAVW